MQIGDLVMWARQPQDGNYGDMGIIVQSCEKSDPPWYRVHWLTDGEEYNYVIDDIDIQLFQKT